MIRRFKLRFYKKTGYDKGNLDHEEFFFTKLEAFTRYNEVFVRSDYSLNPTIWEYINGSWERIYG